jgi:hypothetical protein
LDPEERIKELEARNALMQNQLEQMKRVCILNSIPFFNFSYLLATNESA